MRLFGGVALAMAVLLAMFNPAPVSAAHVKNGQNELLNGTPPFERFAPDLDVFPQNFGIVQDARGIVFVGNAEGVLEFDGERWRLIRLPNSELVRSLAVAPDGTIYVGGFNEFGRLKRDETGRNSFESLLKYFPDYPGGLDKKGREIADIWETVVTPEGVYFRSLRDVFFWSSKSDKHRVWTHEQRFGSIVWHEGRTLLQFREQGLKQRDGDNWNLLEYTKPLDKLIDRMVPLSADVGGGLLTMGKDGKWWQVTEDRATPAKMPAGIPSSEAFTRGAAMRDGGVALTTSDGQVYLLDAMLNIRQRFTIDPGFLSGIAVGADGGLLVAADRAIYRIRWPSPWTVFAAETDAVGSIENVGKWNGDYLLFTSAGVQRASEAVGGGVKFDLMPWAASGAYDLVALDATRALVAGSHRMMLLTAAGKSHQPIGAEFLYPRMFLKSRFHPNTIFLGTENGLHTIDVSKPVPLVSAASPVNVAMRVSTIVERSATELLVGSERHGIWRYRLDAAGRIVESARIEKPFGVTVGSQARSTVATLSDGTIVAGARNGLFRLAGENFVQDAVGGLDKLRGQTEILQLAFGPNNDEWAFSETRVFVRTKSTPWRLRDVRNLRRGAMTSIFFDGPGRAMFVSTNALLLHQDVAASDEQSSPMVQLRAVVLISADGTQKPLPLTGGSPFRLAEGDHSLRFEFALPDLSGNAARRYQSRLFGLEKNFSDWAAPHEYTYSALNAGNYAFQARAVDAQGRETETEKFTFVIEPPWYRSGWAQTLAFIAGLVLLWFAIVVLARRRTARLQALNAKLEVRVAERTLELANANRRLDMMAHVDGLTGIANRRRLDEYLEAVWVTCRDQQKPLSVLIIDVDHFKAYNDRRGHLAGDELLRQITQLLLGCLRRTEDLLARYGGEEFLVVLPGAEADIAQSLAEAMRIAIEGSALGITVSIGVSRVVPNGGSVAELLEEADAALYAAKRGGRNQVMAQRRAA